MNNLKFDKEPLKVTSDHYAKSTSQDDSGLFLCGAEVGFSPDMDSTDMDEVNNDPRFRIRVVM